MLKSKSEHLAGLVERTALDLGAVSLSPVVGAEITLKKIFLNGIFKKE